MLAMKISLEDQHILLVDDNPSNLLLIELLLEENHIRHIYKATSAKEAFKILETQPIDAVLMDVMMPEINGIEACKIIRQNRHYDAIPIIMVTAVDDNETFKESFQVGADDFIPKPINDVVLISRLKSQLEKYQMHQTLIEQSRFSAMDEVISMLAHQWRQPLGVINAIANNVRTKIELGGLNKEDVFEAFNNIEVNLEELSKLINDFQKSFSSQQKKECTNLAQTIHEVLKLHESTIKKLGIQIKTDISISESYILPKQAVVQVLAHIIKNSFDSFSRFDVEHPTINITLTMTEGYAVLAISDNGNGISEADFPFIFEPYFSTKEEKNGKGLGLYFAKQIAEKQLLGALTVTSDSRNTTATVTISLDQLC